MTSAPVSMCPRHPEPVPLAHPLPVLKEALEKVSGDPRGTWVCGLGLGGEGEGTFWALAVVFTLSIIHSFNIQFLSTCSVLGTRETAGRRFCPAVKKY